MCLVSCPVPSDHFTLEQKLTIKSGFFTVIVDTISRIIIDPAVSSIILPMLRKCLVNSLHLLQFSFS